MITNDNNRGAHLLFLKSFMEGFGAPQNDANYAYNNNLPCLNPMCKSHGRPHPNCRCYAHMAEGGEMEHFCSTSRPHKPDCEYFADGGLSSAIEPDLSNMTPPSSSNGIEPDLTAMQAPTDYESTGQQFLTGAEGAAQGYLGPIATGAELALSKLGVPGISAQDIAAREAANPNVHRIGEAAGLIGGGLSGTGLAGMTAEIGEHLAPTFLGKIGSAFLKNGIAQALVQGSDETTKAILGQGNPNDAVGPALANMGWAGLFGGLIGGGAAAVGKGLGSLGTGALNYVGNDAELPIGTSLKRLVNGAGYQVARVNAAKTGIPLGSDIMQQGIQAAEQGDAQAFQSALNKQQNIFNPPDYDTKEFQSGIDLVNKLTTSKPLTLSDIGKGAKYGAAAGYYIDGLKGAMHGAITGATSTVAGRVAQKAVSQAGQYAVPGLFRMLTNAEGEAPQGIVNALNYFKNVSDGTQKVSSFVNDIFQPGFQQANKNAEATQKLKDIIKEYHDNGGIDQNIQQQLYQDNQSPIMPQYAEGGIVEPQEPTPMQEGKVTPLLNHEDPLANHFPEQNMLLQAARTRVSNYLNGLKPQSNPQQFPFDKKPDQSAQERQYNKAIDMAINPLGLSHKIKEGRLTSEDMQHFTSLYPELHDHLQKKITERIIDAQLKGEKPSSKVRQSLSLFMGAPLEKTLSQPMIAAAQSVFASQQPQAPQGQPPKKNKKGTAGLNKVSEQYQTASDTASMRAQQTE